MAKNENCTSKQTFCIINGQDVGNNSDIAFSFVNCIDKNEIITNEVWNELYNEIIKIYNYGKRGTRNPTQPFNLPLIDVNDTHSGYESVDSKIISTDISNIQQNDNMIIQLNEFNKILTAISEDPITSDTPSIYKSYFSNLVTKINNIQLNADRCNNCNTACNTSCQASCNSNCCDSDCNCCTTCYNTCSSCDWCDWSEVPCFVNAI